MALLNADGTESNGNGRIKISQTTAIQIITWLVAGLLTYGAVNARVAVLESRVDSLKYDIGEIKQDVKQLLRENR
jgi:hypothetical protein